MSSWWAGMTALAVSACTGAKPPEPPAGGPSPSGLDPATVAEGEALYDKYCKLCHGERGVGYAADNANALGNPEFLATASDPFLYTAIERGRPGTAMAAYSDELGGPLSQKAMRTIITYLRSLRAVDEVKVDELSVRGDPAAGAPIYAEKCASCHGDKGQGTEALSLSNPLFLASASDGYIRYAIDKGRSGTPMPAFGGTLSASDIDNLTRFIRSWARNVEDGPALGEVPPSFENAVIHPDGPAPAFGDLREGRYVPVDLVKAELERGARMVLLDARPTSDWLKSHIPGALPFPYYDTDKMVESLPRDGTWIIAYCACPHAASGKVMDALREQGFANTAVLDEGILVWSARGYPLTFGANP